MNTILFFITAIAVILGGFSLAMYLLFQHQLSNGVTFAEMEQCEDDIEKRYYKYATQYRKTHQDGSLDAVDIDALTRELNLKVEQATLPSPVRGILEAPDSPNCNGIIRYTKAEDKPYSENFDILHEIIHYLKDVGVGKKVSTSFARTHHGNPRSHQEQVVDYYAAAMAIPKDSLGQRIDAYSGDPYSDEFISEMMEVYGQPRETVSRRINEVIALF